MKKLVAREVNPEWVDTSVYFDFRYEAEQEETLAICGNDRLCNFKGYTFEQVEETLRNCELDDILSDETLDNEQKLNYIETIIPCKKVGGYTVADLNGLNDCMSRFGKRGERDEVILADILSIVWGYEWVYTELRGCSQGDWNGAYFNTRYYSSEVIEYIEGCYFGTGTEYTITIEENGEEMDSFSDYYVGYYDTDKLKQAMKDSIGTEVDEVEVYTIKRYTREPIYKVA